MPKYWVKNYFAHGRFPEVGQKQKTEKKRRRNTPGTAGGPGGRDRTLAVKSRKTSELSPFFLKKIKFTPKKYFFLHISSSYDKILGEKLFRTWEIPRSGSKAEDGGKYSRDCGRPRRP